MTDTALIEQAKAERDAEMRAWYQKQYDAKIADERHILDGLTADHLFTVKQSFEYDLPEPVKLPTREVVVYRVTVTITRFPNATTAEDRETEVSVRADVKALRADGKPSTRSGTYSIYLTDDIGLTLAALGLTR